MECEKVIPYEILVDLCSRFVINVPIEERSDLTRICFQVELAHWFYIDFYSKNFPHKKPCGLKEFTLQIFKHIPFLQSYAENVDEVIDEWKDYKFCVPTFGAILLDEDLSHILLVQNFKSCWGFPKGKVNKDEPPHQCAIREVYEETGFDISDLIVPNEYIEANLNNRIIRLYIITGVSKSEKFVPKTRNEIKAVDWFPIYDIPLSKKNSALKQLKTGGGNTLNAGYNAFYMVSPFLRKLRHWIYEHSNHLPRRKRSRNKSCSDIDRINSLNVSESFALLKPCQASPTGNPFKTEFGSGCYEPKDSKKLVRNLSEVFSSHHYSGRSMGGLHFSGTDQSERSALLRNAFCGTLGGEECQDSKLKSLLSFEKTNFQPVNKKNPVFDMQCLKDSWNISIEAHSQPLLSITSKDSAFRKVEKSSKLNKRKRGKNKTSTAKEFDSAPPELDSYSPQNETPLIRHKGVQKISSLLNFQFDLSSIIECMNEAVLKSGSI